GLERGRALYFPEGRRGPGGRGVGARGNSTRAKTRGLWTHRPAAGLPATLTGYSGCLAPGPLRSADGPTRPPLTAPASPRRLPSGNTIPLREVDTCLVLRRLSPPASAPFAPGFSFG